MNKIYYSERTIKTWVHDIIRAMNHDGFRPDYIVGLTRGGLVPAVMLSHYLDVPMHSLGVSLRDGDGTGPESNCWMAEDAYGYTSLDEQEPTKILIVDL
jgi:hypoxanthine phosphoribosyltransferase